ncbi:MAG: SH3 domain-containing protein [Acidimicrobiia bacterium]|nr:SH3 domain-containing protein [Acidimicrobiia bacterium]
MHTPYDTTELPVVAGQEVAVLERDDESGWWWCRTVTGDAVEGWVPAAVFDA